MQAFAIAPCGFNCALCAAYQNNGRPCKGCRSDGVKQKHCENCVIRKCTKRPPGEFCTACAEFPCKRLQQLDARYKKQHRTSLIANLHEIEKKGMDAFLQTEEKRWVCKSCGETVCIHKDACLHCGAHAAKRFSLRF